MNEESFVEETKNEPRIGKARPSLLLFFQNLALFATVFVDVWFPFFLVRFVFGYAAEEDDVPLDGMDAVRNLSLLGLDGKDASHRFASNVSRGNLGLEDPFGYRSTTCTHRRRLHELGRSALHPKSHVSDRVVAGTSTRRTFEDDEGSGRFVVSVS